MNHDHKEAFCLMTYECELCGHRESIWNSRDGVTPFAMGCRRPGCDGIANHVEWEKDSYLPDHLPEPGDLLWIDMPDSLRMPLARRRVAQFVGTPYYPPEDVMEETLTNIAASYREGEPWLIRWLGGEDTLAEMTSLAARLREALPAAFVSEWLGEMVGSPLAVLRIVTRAFKDGRFIEAPPEQEES